MVMFVHHFSSRDSLELLPSILIQRCMGKYFVYISWLTETVAFSPDKL